MGTGVTLSFSSYGCALPRRTKLNTLACRASNFDMGLKTNFYKVLSLESESVGAEEIKKAYRSMALRYHPDACPPGKKESSTRMFIELHRAYETLSNPALRNKYDNELRKSKTMKEARLEFFRETWEAQLHELRRRSDNRERAKVGSREA
ncbi:chaperone protein dnaJ 20, chloroplastic-like [Phoenix dactylifera]|uniref:Chaperone protein dnaJ 20, chloroplastic-like n=1 Tax=Phoenix dactylifera TaxID=42345 RepID=A0A8B7C3P0_PHODC|nr:chaperone protein dnaJ 20, chloroplastic-like [Phoenix dactylifera]